MCLRKQNIDKTELKHFQDNKVEQVMLLSITDGHNFSDNGEFDPGSGRTLAACFIHASRTRISSLLERKVADG